MKTFTEEQPLGEVTPWDTVAIDNYLDILENVRVRVDKDHECKSLTKRIYPQEPVSIWFDSKLHGKILGTIDHVRVRLRYAAYDINVAIVERILYYTIMGIVENKSYATGDPQQLEIKNTATPDQGDKCYLCKYGINLSGV